MSTLAEQIRELQRRLEQIEQLSEYEGVPGSMTTGQDKELRFGQPLPASGQLPQVKPTGNGIWLMRTADDQIVWIYGTKPDPACTEPVRALFNNQPVTVMKMPGVHPDRESRGYIVR